MRELLDRTVTMGKALQSDYRTNIEAFRAFIDDRPDDEKWELIDGEIVLNPTPTNRHEIIIHNLEVELELERRRIGASWQIHGGIGTRRRGDQLNESVPDLMVVPKLSEVANWTYDILAIFEVLSPFSVRRDMVRKRGFYAGLDTLTHYIALAQDRCEVTVFARSEEFAPRRVTEGTIDLAALGVSLELTDVYRDVIFD